MNAQQRFMIVRDAIRSRVERPSNLPDGVKIVVHYVADGMSVDIVYPDGTMDSQEFIAAGIGRGR